RCAASTRVPWRRRPISRSIIRAPSNTTRKRVSGRRNKRRAAGDWRESRMETVRTTAPGPAGARFFDVARSALAVLLVSASIAWAADVYRMFGLVLFMEQY